MFNEVKDMDDAIKVAYEFYKKHPKETLIVVTADHETGGIVTWYRKVCAEPESTAISETLCRRTFAAYQRIEKIKEQ